MTNTPPPWHAELAAPEFWQIRPLWEKICAASCASPSKPGEEGGDDAHENAHKFGAVVAAVADNATHEDPEGRRKARETLIEFAGSCDLTNPQIRSLLSGMVMGWIYAETQAQMVAAVADVATGPAAS